MFDWLKRKKKPKVTPAEEPASALGWDAIEAAFALLYPGSRPLHWKHDGILRMHDLRNPPENPFDGVNVYDAGSFWHYVSLGMSELYGKDDDSEWSGFGSEAARLHLIPSHELLQSGRVRGSPRRPQTLRISGVLPTGLPPGLLPKSATPRPKTSFISVKCRSRSGLLPG